MKNLILIRGIPGSGKSTLAASLQFFEDPSNVCVHYEADNYFIDEWGKYVFDIGKIDTAHQVCYNDTEKAMQWAADTIIVSNTFTRESEIGPYRELAEKYRYNVQEIWIMPSKFESIHAVPEKTYQKMKTRFFNAMREMASNYLKEMNIGNS